MEDFVHQAVTALGDWPGVVKFLALIFAVTLEYIFPIFPGDTIVLLAGFLHAYNALSLTTLSFAILIGTLVGASVAYGAGRLIDRHRNNHRLLSFITSHNSYRKFGIWYRKWGLWFLLFNRFFPGIRALFFLAAGVEKISFAKVLLLGGLSAVLYNAFLVVIGYLLGFNAERIMQYFYQYNAIALILIFSVILGLAFSVWRMVKK